MQRALGIDIGVTAAAAAPVQPSLGVQVAGRRGVSAPRERCSASSRTARVPPAGPRPGRHPARVVADRLRLQDLDEAGAQRTCEVGVSLEIVRRYEAAHRTKGEREHQPCVAHLRRRRGNRVERPRSPAEGVVSGSVPVIKAQRHTGQSRFSKALRLLAGEPAPGTQHPDVDAPLPTTLRASSRTSKRCSGSPPLRKSCASPRRRSCCTTVRSASADIPSARFSTSHSRQCSQRNPHRRVIATTALHRAGGRARK